MLAEFLYFSFPLLVPLAISFLYACIQLGSYGFYTYCAEARIQPLYIRRMGRWDVVGSFLGMEFARSIPIAVFSYGIWGVTTAIDLIWTHASLSRPQIGGIGLSVLLIIIAPGCTTISSWASEPRQLLKINMALLVLSVLSLFLTRTL